MTTLHRDGVAIHYEHYRCVDANAPVILLSHGYSATAAMWNGQVETLTRTLL